MREKEKSSERQIRDYYAANLPEFRPRELVLGKEVTYKSSSVRVDMRTVCSDNVIYEWEFKKFAEYKSLGQILTYMSLAELEFGSGVYIRGVIAAFGFDRHLQQTLRIQRLHIELVKLPDWIRNAGYQITEQYKNTGDTELCKMSI